MLYPLPLVECKYIKFLNIEINVYSLPIQINGSGIHSIYMYIYGWNIKEIGGGGNIKEIVYIIIPVRMCKKVIYQQPLKSSESENELPKKCKALPPMTT